MNNFRMAAVLLPIAFLHGASAPAQQAVGEFIPVTDAMLEDPDPANWMMWRRTLDSWGYSPLSQTDRDNVRELRMVWSRPLADGIQEGTPLVYDGVMYFPNPYAETGETLWKYEQRASTTSLIATGGGLIFGGDSNGRFRAFDQETGEVLWEINIGSQVTGFPATYAVDGKQYVAVSTGSALAIRSLLALTPELRPGSGNNLFVFALPD